MKNKMLELIRLYKKMDVSLKKFYSSMQALGSNSARLRIMWRGLSSDEKEHLLYWNYLEKTRYGLNCLKDTDIDSVIRTLKKVYPETAVATAKAAAKQLSLEKAFDMAVNIEFSALVSPMQEVFFNHDLILTSGVFNPKLNYDVHLKRISSMAPFFYSKDPVKLTLIKSFGEIKKAKERSLSESLTDPLTGLRSRRYFFENMEFLMELACREKRPITLIMSDINGFKTVNDNYGHVSGDRLLKAVGDIFKKKVRSSDIAARFGGDEFIVALYGKTEKDAEMFIRHIEKDVAAISLKTETGGKIKTSLSCGFSLMSAGSKTSLNSLISEADKAMYKVKESRK